MPPMLRALRAFILCLRGVNYLLMLFSTTSWGWWNLPRLWWHLCTSRAQRRHFAAAYRRKVRKAWPGFVQSTIRSSHGVATEAMIHEFFGDIFYKNRTPIRFRCAHVVPAKLARQHLAMVEERVLFPTAWCQRCTAQETAE